MKKFLLLLSFYFLLSNVNSQDIIHYWHFNNISGAYDSLAANTYNGTNAPYVIYRESHPNVLNKGYMDNVTGSAVNARNGEAPGQGIRPRNPSDSMELYIQLPSSGFENIILSYAVQRSGQGMLKQVLYYSTDGISYTPHADTVHVTETYTLVTFNFSSISAVNNNSNFAVKVRFFEQNTAPNGNNRLDNIVLEGNSLGGAVTSVQLDLHQLQLSIGDTQRLNATVLPLNATDKSVTWLSVDSQVASVSSTGLITALSNGTTSIVVITNDGSFTDTCHVQVFSNYDVTFNVSASSNPIAGARIISNTDTVYTDANGSATMQLMPGSHSFDITATNFISQFVTLNLSADTTISIVMQEVSNVLVHYWHFNNIASGTLESVLADFSLLPDVIPSITYVGAGSGYMDEVSPGSSLNVQMGESEGKGLRVRNNSHTKFLVIPLPTNSCEKIVLSFDVTRSGQGMLKNNMEYTLDGTNYQNTGLVSSQINITESYITHYFDFTQIAGVDSNPNFGVRISFEGNTQQENGNNRYDNIAMFATTNLEASIANMSVVSNIKLFPNPASRQFFIENAPLGATYEIVSLHGQLVQSGIISNSTQQVNLSEISTSVLIVRMYDEKQSYVSKIVVE
jgi:uncharacterized protein YjdB